WTAWLRSPDRLQNTFAHECFMDEIAASLNADPIQYRLRHLSDPRFINVVNTVAQKANWRHVLRPTPVFPASFRNPAGAGASPASCTKGLTATAPQSPRSWSI